MYLICSAAAVALCFFVFSLSQISRIELGSPERITGYTLFSIMIFLVLFNVRKRLSMVPLGKARHWFVLHVVIGVAALPMYWMHTETLWPTGFYEQLIAFCFYVVAVTGIWGFMLLKVYPSRLTETGIEVIYERVPAEIAAIREEAQRIVLACSEVSGNETLARQYNDRLAWFFDRPRFGFNHFLGARTASAWWLTRLNTVRKYLAASELDHLAELEELGHYKNKVDLHYAVQRTFKAWLLIHVPAAVALIILSVWHFVIVHMYLL